MIGRREGYRKGNHASSDYRSKYKYVESVGVIFSLVKGSRAKRVSKLQRSSFKKGEQRGTGAEQRNQIRGCVKRGKKLAKSERRWQRGKRL
jgi:hypothetical protein